MKHVPQRTCVACRTRRDKAALVRVVRRSDGLVVMDHDGRTEGRGAYLCADGACWALALKRSALQRALGRPLPQDIKARLEHGDAGLTGVMPDRGAPAASTGGTHGA